MSTLKRSKLLTQKELEERRRKRIYRDLRSPRKKVGGPSPDFTNSREISDPISRKKPVQSRSRHQSVAEDKSLSPKDKFERDVLGKDMSDKYKSLKKLNSMKKGGRAGYQGGGRTRLLEELGRVEAEPSNRNRRAEISRVHSELNKGYKGGGAVLKGKKVGCQIK